MMVDDDVLKHKKSCFVFFNESGVLVQCLHVETFVWAFILCLGSHYLA